MQVIFDSSGESHNLSTVEGTLIKLIEYKDFSEPNIKLFRTFQNTISPTNALGQFVRMLLGNNNIKKSDFEQTKVLDEQIQQKRGSIYRAYVTQNKSVTWNNIENIQLIKE